MTDHAFSPAERSAIYRVISERRDMRRFVPGSAVSEEVLIRLLQEPDKVMFPKSNAR